MMTLERKWQLIVAARLVALAELVSTWWIEAPAELCDGLTIDGGHDCPFPAAYWYEMAQTICGDLDPIWMSRDENHFVWSPHHMFYFVDMGDAIHQQHDAVLAEMYETGEY